MDRKFESRLDSRLRNDLPLLGMSINDLRSKPYYPRAEFARADAIDLSSRSATTERRPDGSRIVRLYRGQQPVTDNGDRVVMPDELGVEMAANFIAHWLASGTII